MQGVPFFSGKALISKNRSFGVFAGNWHPSDAEIRGCFPVLRQLQIDLFMFPFLLRPSPPTAPCRTSARYWTSTATICGQCSLPDLNLFVCSFGRSFVCCCWLLVVGCWLLFAVCCLLFVVCCLLVIVCCLLFVG